MGVFDVQDTIITIHDPKWEASQEARARTTVLVADEEWVQNQLVKIKQETQDSGNRAFRRQKQAMSFDAQIGASKRLWTFKMLVDWTFTKDGMPMPLSLEAVKHLPQSVLDFIYDAIQVAQPKDEEDTEQGDDEEGADPTLNAALLSIVGEMSGEEEADLEALLEGKKAPRNFLSKF